MSSPSPLSGFVCGESCGVMSKGSACGTIDTGEEGGGVGEIG